jgi:hypothetical protein
MNFSHRAQNRINISNTTVTYGVNIKLITFVIKCSDPSWWLLLWRQNVAALGYLTGTKREKSWSKCKVDHNLYFIIREALILLMACPFYCPETLWVVLWALFLHVRLSICLSFNLHPFHTPYASQYRAGKETCRWLLRSSFKNRQVSLPDSVSRLMLNKYIVHTV